MTNDGYDLKRRPWTICIEGNIGSGKSTLLEAGYEVITEPVDERWGELLKLFYADPKLYGLPFQIEVIRWFRLMDESLKHADAGNIRCVERSPSAAFQIFSRNLFQAGLIEAWEMEMIWKILNSWGWAPEHTIYIDTPPAEAHSRILTRARRGEETVPKQLLEDLHTWHEVFLTGKWCGEVHRIDGTKT
jgi:deoxyadenosine/deoxycytidine kinase